MTTPANSKKMLLDSDYPIDKIVFSLSGSLTVPNGTSDSFPYPIQFPHGLSFTPLTILLWSNTSDFTVTNEGMDAALLQTALTTSVGQEYSAFTDSSNIAIYRYNNSGSSQTVYYRIFCFMPSDASEDSLVGSTASSGTPFILNTEHNYMKLYKAGILTTTDNIYSHGLGYIPRVQIWSETGGVVDRYVQSQQTDNDLDGSGGATSGVFPDTNNLTWLNPATYDKIHYRIYVDA